MRAWLLAMSLITAFNNLHRPRSRFRKPLIPEARTRREVSERERLIPIPSRKPNLRVRRQEQLPTMQPSRSVNLEDRFAAYPVLAGSKRLHVQASRNEFQ